MMIVAADASVLVAELPRQRGRALLTHTDLRVVVAEQQWEETEHELRRRVGAMVATNRLSGEQGAELLRTTLALATVAAIEVIRGLSPRDPRVSADARVVLSLWGRWR